MKTDKYVVAVIGFSRVEDALAAIRTFMEEEKVWLFTIAGTSGGMGKEIAETLGAPYLYVNELWQLERECNYLIADIRSDNQAIKNWVMKMKAAGKHGRVIR